jgi:hypothetical protein
MRFCVIVLLAAVAIATAGVAGCQGNGAAVSVRWRIVDLSTGQAWDANDRSIDYNTVCCRADLDPKRTCASSTWIVRGVKVVLGDPETDAPTPLKIVPQATCPERELTSKFDLPTGTWAVSLVADVPDMGTPVVTPAPQLRDFERGGVVNLDVVEIGVDPLPHPLPTTDGGVTQ